MGTILWENVDIYTQYNIQYILYGETISVSVGLIRPRIVQLG